MLKFGNTYLNYNGTYFDGYKVPTYNVVLQQDEIGIGIISADPMSGHRNTEVTLSSYPNYYDFRLDGYYLTGSTLYDSNKFKFEDSDVTAKANWTYTGSNPYNPLNLSFGTFRLKYAPGTKPLLWNATASQFSQELNIWDVTFPDSDIIGGLHDNSITEIIGANTYGITNMSNLFFGCNELSSIKFVFDTSRVSAAESMFMGCGGLTNIPLFDTSRMVNMIQMFQGCFSVRSGALALYNQASTQATPPTAHSNAFHSCGSNNQTGSAELAQIPDSWK